MAHCPKRVQESLHNSEEKKKPGINLLISYATAKIRFKIFFMFEVLT